MTQLKVAVYAIARDEARHVARFMASTKGADAVYVADTGSTDDTKGLLSAAGAIISACEVVPFRFDEARNFCLDQVPETCDVCVTLDLDEVLTPNWRPALEAAWRPGTSSLQIPYALFHGTTFVSAGMNPYRVHARRGWKWSGAVHERLLQLSGDDSVPKAAGGFGIEHRPDMSKPRDVYIAMAQKEVQEQPDNRFALLSLTAELLRHRRYPECVAAVQDYLARFPDDPPMDRCDACMRAARACSDMRAPIEQVRGWLVQAIETAPFLREPRYYLAELLHVSGQHGAALKEVERALAITTKGPYWEPAAWGRPIKILYEACRRGAATPAAPRETMPSSASAKAEGSGTSRVNTR